MIHQIGSGRCMIREMPPGAEWTLYYMPGDVGDSAADFERLRNHPEIRNLHHMTGQYQNRIRLQFVDDVQMPRDTALLDLYVRRGTPPRPRPDYGWPTHPADPTARLAQTLAIPPHLLQHDVSHRDVANGIEPNLDPAQRRPSLAFAIQGFAREWAGEFAPREAIPEGIQPIIDFDPNPELLAQGRLNLTVRHEITVLGPDIGNTEQWWRRKADGLLGRTVSRPVNGIVRLQGFANAGAALEVPFDTFIRDWLPTDGRSEPSLIVGDGVLHYNGAEVYVGQRYQHGDLVGSVRSLPNPPQDTIEVVLDDTDTDSSIEAVLDIKVRDFFLDWTLCVKVPTFWDRLLAEES